MTRNEFAEALGARLSGLPREDRTRAVSYYCEMIDDRIEDGMTEPAAVAALGPIDDIVKETLEGVPLHRLVKERMRPRRTLSAGEITLIVLGSPVWLPLLVAAAAVVLTLYLVFVFAVVITLFAVTVALYGTAVGGAVGGIALLSEGEAATGLMTLGGAFVSLAGGALLTLALIPVWRLCVALHMWLIGKIKQWLFRKEKTV